MRCFNRVLKCMSNDAHWFSVICWANDLRASTPNFSWVMLLTWSILWNLNVRCPRCLWVDVTRHREMPSVSMSWRHQAQGDALGVYELTSPGTGRCPRCLWVDVTRHREMPSVSMSWRHQAWICCWNQQSSSSVVGYCWGMQITDGSGLPSVIHFHVQLNSVVPW